MREELENLRLLASDYRAQAEDAFLRSLRVEDEIAQRTARIARLGGIDDLPEFEPRRQRIRKAVSA